MTHSIGRHRRTVALAITLLGSVVLPAPLWAQNVVGTVSDSSATRALDAAEIELVELQRTITTDRDGSFRFSNVPAGTYTLVARYTSAAPVTRTITVPASGEVRADFQLGSPDDGAVLVIGQRANLASSISRQRAGEGVSTVLTRDAIGQFPDQNVAEALRRAPGVNVLNDQGEGRFVSVRGLDPELNSTSINGNRVLATGGDSRAAALDVIPSELVESITIKKSLTPDMDADTLGGSIEIETTSAFDRKKPFLGLSVEGSYNDLREAWSPKAGIDFSIPLGNDFGIAGGLSYYKRRFSSDNIEANGWNEANGIVYAEELDYRDYDVTRERIGASLSFDARVGGHTELYARGLYSKFDDTELRRRLIFAMSEEPASGTTTSASFDSADGRIQVRRDLKDRGEWQEIKTASFGGKTELDGWKFVYDAAWSQATQTENNSIDPIRFQERFQTPGALGVTFDYSNPKIPGYSIDFGQDNFVNTDNYELTLLERTTAERAKDEEYSFRADATRSFALPTGGTFDIQAGTRLRFRDKRQDMTIDLFDGYDGDLTLTNVMGRQTYGLADLGPVPDLGKVQDFLAANGYGNFERNDFESEWASAADDYRAREDIYAGYLLGRYVDPTLRVVGGIRMEHTENRFFGNRVDVNEDEETLVVTPVVNDRSYTDWLPSLNVRFEPSPGMVLRGAAYKSLVRPKISSVAPRFIVEENDEGERSGEFGNPDLKPYRAWNFDVAAEYYFSRDAAVSIGGFYKRIDDFVVTGEFDNVTFNGITVDEGVIPLNGETATVKGVEFSYQQALTFLPAPFDGLLVNFNYTYTDAEGRLADGEFTDGRTIDLPASSKHTFNAVVGYEKGPLSLRAAGAYRSGYLDEIGGEPESDRYVDKHFQADFTAKYRLTPNVQIVGEFINAFDEPYYAYQRGASGRQLLQYEEYSWTAKIGVRANF